MKIISFFERHLHTLIKTKHIKTSFLPAYAKATHTAIIDIIKRFLIFELRLYTTVNSEMTTCLVEPNLYSLFLHN
jgi:hypothetical protein